MKYGVKKKLSTYPATAADLVVNIANPGELTDIERQQILKICNRFNMAVYQCDNKDVDSTTLRKFAEHCSTQKLQFPKGFYLLHLSFCNYPNLSFL